MESLFLIAGMLPMSTALVKVGLVGVVANAFVVTLGELGPMFVLAGLFILTTMFTQVLSNTATALLIAPNCGWHQHRGWVSILTLF